MRLTPYQKIVIIQAIKRCLGQNTRIWLFGSRVDDKKRGGDIDLLIEIETPCYKKSWQIKAIIRLDIEKQLGEQKIDLLLRTRADPILPIHLIAKETGVEL